MSTKESKVDQRNYSFNQRPKSSGLYDANYEHDACGMGFISHLDGKPSRSIVDDGLIILERLVHRGGTGAEEDTGDGAGILLAMPDKFLRAICQEESGVELPPKGEYAVAMAFLPRDEKKCIALLEETEQIVKAMGFKMLLARKVPYSFFDAGPAARDCMPNFYQLFITGNGNFQIDGDFEHKIYVLRRTLEQKIRFAGNDDYYFSSFSSKTLVYKGMLHAWQIRKFFPDLEDERMESSICVVHSRFSTNTFPSWDRAQPCRFIAHNGEINTLRGNENWFKARESVNDGGVFKNVRKSVIPVIDDEGSDSTKFDNCLEFLCLQGRPLPQVLLMMIPEAWSKAVDISDEMKSFYEYSANIMEPWDGPAAICFSDGRYAGAILDRNGLRPSRYQVTKDRRVILSSEAGVLDIPFSETIEKGRLGPGEMILVDTEQGKMFRDHQVKEDYAQRHDYKSWLDKYRKTEADLPKAAKTEKISDEKFGAGIKAFGYTFEGIQEVITPMARDGKEPISAMGMDIPLAVLSKKPQLLYNYFKQLFAQVTNPPIDALREEIVTGTEVFLGASGNFAKDAPENCKKLRLDAPILDSDTYERILNLNEDGFKTKVLDILYDIDCGGFAMESALEKLFEKAEEAIEDGATILVLSDRNFDENMAGIPALLAVSGLHHHLIRKELRGRADIILDSAEPSEVHHFATLVGYGVSAIHPYLAYRMVEECVDRGYINDISKEKALYNYKKAVVKGIVKVMSKMGISCVQSYQGAQIFEALGISKEVVDRYFTGTSTRVDGLKLRHIADETKKRHLMGFGRKSHDLLNSGGVFQYKPDGEVHMYNPETVHIFQRAVRENDYELYKKYKAKLQNEESEQCTLRSLMEFSSHMKPVDISEVEPVERIVQRFKTGAMSYGSISEEAHTTLAIALNRLKGKSNSGEGGEDRKRFQPLENGDSMCSAIKQIASGRFGVTAEYLASAKEIQIKMAQGAKPGEGGHLPGHKVYPWIARVRHSTPGVGLISPPPHHDIYSIEDLAQLIYDLKNANPAARVNVKLVSEVGVGTIAAGVAKGRADVILVSGYDGGTGASPRTSTQHAGLPWELGVAETHQTLEMNGLRDRVILETDGKMMTGRDVIIAALLGAEEYGFATLPLVAMGCIMMRVCNLNTCPVGVATQHPELRKRFIGKPEHVENCLKFIAMDMREIMAELGFRSMEELIGKSTILKQRVVKNNDKANSVDLTSIIVDPNPITRKHMAPLAGASEWDHYFAAVEALVESNQKVEINMPISNIDRTTGTRLGGWLAKRYGDHGLADDSIVYNFKGTAGQSLGAFLPKGITLNVEGDSNDYVAKGLCGGKIIVAPPKDAAYVPEENTVIGNVACYGATSGELYARGMAGERFCVRNSGVLAVVEGVGDHGCEYMTGGKAVILGEVGYNFAAGMSGGVAYVYDVKGDLEEHCNMEMITIAVPEIDEEIEQLKALITNHQKYTGSTVAEKILKDWDKSLKKFKKVMPIDYKEMLDEIEKATKEGYEGEEMLTIAFERKVAAK
ncbi:MAG: glutamate synthase large subunit [Eubacteriales bacterium]